MKRLVMRLRVRAVIRLVPTLRLIKMVRKIKVGPMKKAPAGAGKRPESAAQIGPSTIAWPSALRPSPTMTPLPTRWAAPSLTTPKKVVRSTFRPALPPTATTEQTS